MSIQPIETRYAGCRFRSRLEARWAVFFDHLGVRWEYEPQGFEIGAGRPYLPDFRLPVEDIWVEVKGDETQLDVELAITAAVPHNGLPGTRRENEYDIRLLILGPHGRAGRVQFKDGWEGFCQPTHTVLAFRKGDIHQGAACFLPNGYLSIETIGEAIGNDGPAVYEDRRGRDWGNLVGGGAALGIEEQPAIAAAYSAARSARFEHGESA